MTPEHIIKAARETAKAFRSSEVAQAFDRFVQYAEYYAGSIYKRVEAIRKDPKETQSLPFATTFEEEEAKTSTLPLFLTQGTILKQADGLCAILEQDITITEFNKDTLDIPVSRTLPGGFVANMFWRWEDCSGIQPRMISSPFRQLPASVFRDIQELRGALQACIVNLDPDDSYHDIVAQNAQRICDTTAHYFKQPIP